MKSKVVKTIDFETIVIDPQLLTLHIPSWDVVVEPLKQQALKQYQEATGEAVTILDDAMLSAIPEIPVNSLVELEELGRSTFQQIQSEQRFYNEIVPTVIEQLVNHTNYVCDEEEWEQYRDTYLDQVQRYADRHQMSVEEYGQQIMGIDGDVQAAFLKRAKEDFVFKLIAHYYIQERSVLIDELAYDAFIQEQVIHAGADEITVREQMSFEEFAQLYPEIYLAESIAKHFYPQMHFVVGNKSER